MWIHDLKNLMAHKKIWHAMTNIGAINSRHTKTYGVTKNHGLHENLWHLVANRHAMSSSHEKLSYY